MELRALRMAAGWTIRDICIRSPLLAGEVVLVEAGDARDPHRVRLYIQALGLGPRATELLVKALVDSEFRSDR